MQITYIHSQGHRVSSGRHVQGKPHLHSLSRRTRFPCMRWLPTVHLHIGVTIHFPHVLRFPDVASSALSYYHPPRHVNKTCCLLLTHHSLTHHSSHNTTQHNTTTTQPQPPSLELSILTLVSACLSSLHLCAFVSHLICTMLTSVSSSASRGNPHHTGSTAVSLPASHGSPYHTISRRPPRLPLGATRTIQLLVCLVVCLSDSPHHTTSCLSQWHQKANTPITNSRGGQQRPRRAQNQTRTHLLLIQTQMMIQM